MGRILKRNDLVELAIELRKIKNAAIAVGMILDMDGQLFLEVEQIKKPIEELDTVLTMVEARISKIDYPNQH